MSAFNRPFIPSCAAEITHYCPVVCCLFLLPITTAKFFVLIIGIALFSSVKGNETTLDKFIIIHLAKNLHCTRPAFLSRILKHHASCSGFGDVNNAVYNLSLSSPRDEDLDSGLLGLINDRDVSVSRCLYLLHANCIATAAHVLHPGE